MSKDLARARLPLLCSTTLLTLHNYNEQKLHVNLMIIIFKISMHGKEAHTASPYNYLLFAVWVNSICLLQTQNGLLT